MTNAMAARVAPTAKFADPERTADGQLRAKVSLRALTTLWFNTGTLCNIACVSCYIESSPRNDSLVYLTEADVVGYLEEIRAHKLGTKEIGFTGGEPFMNPAMEAILRTTLARGFDALVLTNAMRPMMRPRVQAYLRALRATYPDTLTLRVSLDGHSQESHEAERGKGTWRVALEGLRWLAKEGFRVHIAARARFQEDTANARAAYLAMFAREGVDLRLNDAESLVVFPEMDAKQDAPEITTDCWSILGKRPEDIMCASSRMVVKRKGAALPEVISCTLLPYDTRFSMGQTLAQAAGPVSLNHLYCAQFCVLGGASCS